MKPHLLFMKMSNYNKIKAEASEMQEFKIAPQKNPKTIKKYENKNRIN